MFFGFCEFFWSQNPYRWDIDVSVCKMGPYLPSILHDVESGMTCCNHSYLACRMARSLKLCWHLSRFVLFFPAILYCQRLRYSAQSKPQVHGSPGLWEGGKRNWTSKTWEYHRIQWRKSWDLEPTKHGLKGAAVHDFLCALVSVACNVSSGMQRPWINELSWRAISSF